MAFTVEERNQYLQQGLKINEQDVLEEYTGAMGTVKIPEGVVEIGIGAFSHCDIKKVIVPQSVKRIKFHGFANCEKLKEVKLSDGLEEIAESAFYYCDKLKVLNIPQSVKKIGKSAFRFCKNLVGFELSVNLEEITDICFNGIGAEAFVVPPKVARVGQWALSCPKMRQVVLSPVLQEIGEKALWNCEKLERVSIPLSLKKIGEKALDMRYLREIYYEGTKEQWEKIEKGTDDYSTIVKFNVAFDYYKQALQITDESVAAPPIHCNECAADNATKDVAKDNKQSKSSAPKPAKSASTQTEQKIKTVADEHNIATNGTEVIINSDLVVTVPKGMLYSTNKEEVNSDTAERCLVFYKEEQNDYYVNEHGVEEYNFAAPFAAPQCFTMHPALDVFGNVDGDFELDNPAILSQLREVINKSVIAMTSDTQTVLESSDMLIYYANSLFAENMFLYAIVTHKGIYRGQIWVNDVDSKQKRTKILKSWLKNIKLESPKVASRPAEPAAEVSQEQQTFAMPTFSGKRASMGELTVAVPDGMMTLEDFGADELSRIREQFATIIVPQGSVDNFDNYLGSTCSISCKKESIIKETDLDDVWPLSEEDVKKQLVSSIARNYGADEKDIYYQRLTEKLAVTFAPFKEGVDQGKFWCNYVVVCFCESYIYMSVVCFNAKEDRATFTAFLKKLVATIEYNSEENRHNFQIEHAKRQLGEFAAEDGKISAVKFTSLLARDVIFWEHDEATFDGEHHSLTAIRFNRKKQSQCSVLNNQTAKVEMANVISFVEQNKNLIIPVEFYCNEFAEIYNNEPITGITALELCMDHFLEIVERSADNYIVTMDMHLLYGIPECYKYIGELIKTLRAYNGKYGNFTYTVMLVKTMEVSAIPLSRPVVGAAKSGGNAPVTVNEGESPYGGVIDSLKK